MTMMKAITITEFGGPEVLTVSDLPRPVPRAGEILIRVRAFGTNRVETFVRAGAFGPLDFPRVLGIEAVGEIADG
ncbi:MAG: hypothetical protein L3J02_08005, partial [Henriciella sp.]|nr:hypothetical protein [Henriciella sp.]